MHSQTLRSRQKAGRREDILKAAARFFAERGFSNVSLDDIGAAVGVSGPALYRHFPSKDAVLAELMIQASRRAVAASEDAIGGAANDAEALYALVAFHANVALRDRDIFRIQEQDVMRLSSADAQVVRRLQRTYVDLWATVLRNMQPELSANFARTKVQATFGLLNSAPHSTSRRSNLEESRKLLVNMAMAALTA